MATFAFTLPAKIYKYHLDDQRRLIDEIITSTSQVVSNGNNTFRFLAEFDVSSVTAHGAITSVQIKPTFDRRPSSQYAIDFQARQYFSVTSNFEVGSEIVLDNQSRYVYDVDGDGGEEWVKATSFRADANDKIYIDIKISAIKWIDGSGHPAPDQEYSFHNLCMSFNTGTDYAFTASLDTGGGYHKHGTSLKVGVTANETQAVKWYKIASGTLYYKEESAGSYSSVALSNGVGTIPSSAFASGRNYKIYATATSDAGTTDSTEVITVTTIDGTAYVNPISPQNEVTNGDLLFRWSYSSSTGEGQYAYDLQISSDGETWTDIFSHVVSSETFATYTQSLSGETYWRVRGYNQNDVAGSWSSPLFYINNIPPQPPVIRSITGNGLQTVAWSADGQVAYHIQVLDSSDRIVYDTGEVYSTSGSALIGEYLQNGTYIFRVRIAAAIGGWSEWASMQKTISATLPSPSFTLTASENGVIVSITPIASSVSFLVYRNGELIGMTESSITDYFVAGTAEYRVVGVSSSTGKYGYSIQTTTFSPKHNQIVTEDGEIFLVNRRLNERSFPQKSITPKYVSYEFLGEDRPSHVFVDGFRKGSFTVAMFDKTGDAEQLLGKKVFFSTTAGWGDWCVVTAINRREVLFGNDVTISMELTSKPEVDV